MDNRNKSLDPQSEWPSQDGKDRSTDFAIIAVLNTRPEEASNIEELFKTNQDAWREEVLATKHESWQFGTEFQQTFHRVVAESIREVLGPVPLPAAPPEHYQIGPMAEGPPTYIIQLWNQAQDLAPILSGVADAYAITEITLRVTLKLKEWAETRELRHAGPSLILTPYQLTSLCEEHVRRTYHPRAKLLAEWFPTTTEFLSGYSSPSHPTGAVEYLVTIKAGRNTYTYAVDGHGRVKSHYVRHGTRTTALTTPTLLLSHEWAHGVPEPIEGPCAPS